MAGKKKRKSKRVAQLARRKLQGKQRKLTADLDRLFALGAGGSAQRPIAVPTPALVDTNAVVFPCPLCNGPLRLVEHAVDHKTEALLRVAHCMCQDCGTPRKIWFRIQPPGAN